LQRVTGRLRLLDMILLYSIFKELAVRSIFSLALLAAVVAATAGCSGLTEKTNAAGAKTNEIGNKVDSAAEGPIDRAASKIGLPRGPASSPSSSERGGN
jgi:hypothetical protein